jgi:hypothetical protein
MNGIDFSLIAVLDQGEGLQGAHFRRIVPRPDGGTTLHWKEVEDWRAWSELSEGCYLLRTNVEENVKMG